MIECKVERTIKVDRKFSIPKALNQTDSCILGKARNCDETNVIVDCSNTGCADCIFNRANYEQIQD